MKKAMLLFCMLASVKMIHADVREDITTTMAATNISQTTTKEGFFPIFRGAKGETGATGATGPAGQKGDIGPAGQKGAKGPAGEKGERGYAGERGLAGPAGTAGPTGPRGPKGTLSSSGADLFTTENRISISGSLFTHLSDKDVTTFGGTQYIPSEGSISISADGYYLISYGASTNNSSPLELFNQTTQKSIAGSLVVTSNDQELSGRSIIRLLKDGDRISLYSPTVPGIALASPPISILGEPVTAYLTISLLRDAD